MRPDSERTVRESIRCRTQMLALRGMCHHACTSTIARQYSLGDFFLP